MSVYSHLFFAGFLPTAFTEAYTVPAGMTVVIRDMEFYNGSSGTPTFNVQLGVSGSTGVFFQENDLAPSKHSQWQGRVVIPSAQGLWIFSSAANVQATISGYLLTP